jgi:hypothetical protein
MMTMMMMKNDFDVDDDDAFGNRGLNYEEHYVPGCDAM